MQRWEPLHYLDNFNDGAGYYFGSWYDPYNEDYCLHTTPCRPRAGCSPGMTRASESCLSR